MGSAAVLAIFDGFFEGLEGALSGISIIVATIFIISVTSIADYIKDKRFVQLQSMIADELITVIRGKFGVT